MKRIVLELMCGFLMGILATFVEISMAKAAPITRDCSWTWAAAVDELPVTGFVIYKADHTEVARYGPEVRTGTVLVTGPFESFYLKAYRTTGEETIYSLPTNIATASVDPLPVSKPGTFVIVPIVVKPLVVEDIKMPE